MADCVILNPNAGGAETVEAARADLAALDLEICTCGSAEEAEELAANAARRDAARVFVAGGDGSVNAAVNGLMRVNNGRTALGVLPAGTGNDFARSIDLPLKIAEAVKGIGNLVPRKADVLDVTLDGEKMWALNVVTGGFSGHMHELLTDEVKKRWGPLAYLRVGVSAASDPPVYAVKLTVCDHDGPPHTARARVHNLILANGRYAGGGFVAAPGRRPLRRHPRRHRRTRHGVRRRVPRPRRPPRHRPTRRRLHRKRRRPRLEGALAGT